MGPGADPCVRVGDECPPKTFTMMNLFPRKYIFVPPKLTYYALFLLYFVFLAIFLTSHFSLHLFGIFFLGVCIFGVKVWNMMKISVYLFIF